MSGWFLQQHRQRAPTAYITHADCRKHNMGADHPESPDRLSAIQDRLMSSGLWDHLLHVEAPIATFEQLARVHSVPYLESLTAVAPASGIVHLDPDTAMSAGTLAAALRAAGAVVQATDMVLAGEASNAFCAVRPPGHHAESRRAMGFCFFNNIAVGIAHALAAGIQRIVVADFDVHHGNGTEERFHGNPKVQMVSIFQHPFYPYSGDVASGTNMHNVPLRAGSRGDVFRAAVTEQWLPVIEACEPEMIFISAGFDAHREDDMASLGLVEDDYAWVTAQLLAAAERYGQGRVVSSLEGGYDLSSLGRSVEAHVRVLAGL